MSDSSFVVFLIVFLELSLLIIGILIGWFSFRRIWLTCVLSVAASGAIQLAYIVWAQGLPALWTWPYLQTYFFYWLLPYAYALLFPTILSAVITASIRRRVRPEHRFPVLRGE